METESFMIMGRIIGTYSGWDHADTFTIGVHDFMPIPELKIPNFEGPEHVFVVCVVEL
jgi:hypothetical protein